MPTCFVIQPFDNGKYDKRYNDTFCPAIEMAGLEPYRVDKDPSVDVPIDAIEKGIRDAAICFADITTDNPNVWYELGYAFASGKAVVMVCSEERESRRYPFDIQHRNIVSYKSESTSDFEQLKSSIVERIAALLTKNELLREVAASDPLATQQGLTQPELAVVASLAGDSLLPDSWTGLYSIKRDTERAGFTPIALALGMRRLIQKKLIEYGEEYDHDEGRPYPAARLTGTGWDWIESNEQMFVLKKGQSVDDEFDDSVPY